MDAQTLSTGQLRLACERAVRDGHRSVVLRAAAASPVWAPNVRLRVVQELGRAGKLPGQPVQPEPRPAGAPPPAAARQSVFPEFLFQTGPEPAPKPTQAASGDVPSPQVPRPAPTVRRLSADTVLAKTSGPDLRFDGTLDGLRGVPITDLKMAAEQHGRTGKQLMDAGIETVFDLLTRVPLRYLDRTELLTVDRLRPGMRQVSLVATVMSTGTFGKPRRRKGGGTVPAHARIVVGHDRNALHCTFFNQSWQARRFNKGDQVLVLGDVTVWEGNRGSVLQMQAPLIEPYNPDSASPMLPIYPQSEKHHVTTWQLGRGCVEALRRIDRLDDPVPQMVRDRLGLPGRLSALRAVHVPENAEAAREGRDRLAFDELLRLQLALGVRRAAQQDLPAVKHEPTGELCAAHLASLPYPLTGAQQRAVKQITADLAADRPMNRLLQGDVGSGKTVTMAQAALTAVESGHQAALMAPTEVLAMQHYRGFVEELAPLGVVVGFLASRQGSRARRETLAGLANGTIHLVVGTQSLLSDDAVFASLGLVMVDEQHRFGVAQRAQMAGKGPAGATPDLLVATATPIPRTAALTVFGDLDVTVLDEMPPGRTPIVTSAVDQADLTDSGDVTWQQVRTQVEAGRQAYVVCPMVADSEKAQAAAAVETAEALQAGALAGLRVGVVTGKQRADERAETMDAFTAGNLDVLVATTVIEVGVNVPNATIIVILDAPRFGLAQLHQLRGRVGRGKHAGSCVLVGHGGDDAQARVDAMCETTDGFRLSEVDLKLRGPGALAGVAQAGHKAGLVVADLLADADLMLQARQAAGQILAADPKLGRRPTLRNEVELDLGDDAEWLLHA